MLQPVMLSERSALLHPSCSCLCGCVWCAAAERMAAAAAAGHDPSAAAARAATPREPYAGIATQPVGPPFARAVSHVRCMNIPHAFRKGLVRHQTWQTSAMRHDTAAIAPNQARLPPCVNWMTAHAHYGAFTRVMQLIIRWNHVLKRPVCSACCGLSRRCMMERWNIRFYAWCAAGPSPRAQDTGHFLINPTGTFQQPPTNSVSSCRPYNMRYSAWRGVSVKCV